MLESTKREQSQNEQSKRIIKVATSIYYYQRFLELYEGKRIIFCQKIPSHYKHTYNVDQLNGMEIKDEQAISHIHHLVHISDLATTTYYESMEPGSNLYGEDNLAGATRIFAEFCDGLKNLLIYLNSVKN